ncbi:DUF637 domain-containing protein [Halotalea alkalilenta]|uniref:DUF637 domain-containing protein n=1 Tax=Halotalea alkalilenta TaxID=376489 RepID=A0A172YBV6_9GAMM|nr:DUF637 domain-containing protein [Halotalea alkalilenta]ANF56698.1 hypothetical protein A5892_03810 [Halotalea alkalilenta]
MGGAAATSLASQGAVNLINQQGDLGGALKDTLSRQGLEGAALASASAGVAQGMDRIWGGRTDVITQGVQGVDLASLEGIGRFAGSIGSRAAIDASLQTALQGGSLGDRLGDALHGTVGSVVAAAMFNAVGDYAEAQGYAEGSVEKVALHALAGGLASVASGGDFESGAIAAGANEALVGHLAEWLEQDPMLLTGAAQITGLVAAGLAGGDAQQGAWVAGQADMYNRQLHPEERRLIKEEAARLQEAHGSAGPLDWETMLTLAAGNRLDADNADTFARLEAQVASDPNNPLAQQFQQAMTVANATIEVLAG